MGATGKSGMQNTLSDLYSFMWELGGKCTQPIMLQALQKGAREFAGKTESWRVWLDHHNIVDEVVEYELDWNYCTELRRILELKMNTEAGVTAGNPGTTIDVTLYQFDEPDILTLDATLKPTADIDNALDVKVVFVPLLNSCDIPRSYLNKYAKGIVGWAMNDLLKIPGKEWSNPVRAIDYLNDYNEDITLAMQEVESRENKDGDPGFKA